MSLKKLKELAFILLTLGLIGLGYNVWIWYEENKELVWSVIISFIVLAVIVFVIYKVYKNKKEKRILDSMPNQVGTIKELLDAFSADIPRFSKHAETTYQVDFGRYLKEKLENHHVVYEETKDGVRPDIIIDQNIAIEIKALKEPNTQSNKEYNSQHIDSIFKKIHTYKVYNQVIIIIFNSGYVKDTGWKDYEKMKEAVQQQDVILFEK